MEHARYDRLEPYVTRDGSITIEHLHRRSEELYLVTAPPYSHEDTVLLEGE
jgi:hypothetical protein